MALVASVRAPPSADDLAALVALASVLPAVDKTFIGDVSAALIPLLRDTTCPSLPLAAARAGAALAARSPRDISVSLHDAMASSMEFFGSNDALSIGIVRAIRAEAHMHREAGDPLSRFGTSMTAQLFR